VIANWREAPLERVSSRALSLCLHAERLTREPAAIARSEIDALRAVGCDDDAIHDLTQVVALFNYYNRIADGLGIDPEPEWR
jgi:uncharacterized peroxidase-related enzyme